MPDREIRPRERIRSLRLLIGLALRADRLRAVIVVLPVPVVVAMVAALILRLFVNALSEGAVDDARTYGFLLGATTALWFGLLSMQSRLTLQLREKAITEVDTEIMSLCGRSPGLEVVRDPAFADDLELLRNTRPRIIGAVPALGQALQLATEIAFTAALLYVVHPLALLMPLAAVPLFVLTKRANAIQFASTTEAASHERTATHLYDLGTGDRHRAELVVAGMRDGLVGRCRDELASADRARLRGELHAACIRGAGIAVLAAAFVGLLLLVARSAVSGDASPGDVMLAVTMVAWIAGQTSEIGMAVAIIDAATVAGVRLLRVRDAVDELERRRCRGRGAVPQRWRRIELRDVEVIHPGRTEPSLRIPSLTLESGTTVAVVGANGAGKSTLVDLLLGLIEPTRGAVLVDGVDLSTVDPREWRRTASAAFQDSTRLEMTVREVIWAGDLDDREIGEADRAASQVFAEIGIQDVVASFPNGFDTRLGSHEGEADLSGGTWQQLTIARAVRARARLLVMDEPTAGLDPVAERRFFDALLAESDDERLCVLVTHRYRSAAGADMIVLLEHGEVVECGTHDELVAAGDRYAARIQREADDATLTG